MRAPARRGTSRRAPPRTPSPARPWWRPPGGPCCPCSRAASRPPPRRPLCCSSSRSVPRAAWLLPLTNLVPLCVSRASTSCRGQAYSSFTQACGVLDMVEPRDAFLASLCRFTLSPSEASQGEAVSSQPEVASGGASSPSDKDATPALRTPPLSESGGMDSPDAGERLSQARRS